MVAGPNDASDFEPERKAQGVVERAQLLRRKRAGSFDEIRFGNSHEPVAVHDALSRQALSASDANLDRVSARRRRGRYDHDHRTNRIGLLTRDQHHRASLVDAGPPHFTPLHPSSHGNCDSVRRARSRAVLSSGFVSGVSERSWLYLKLSAEVRPRDDPYADYILLEPEPDWDADDRPCRDRTEDGTPLFGQRMPLTAPNMLPPDELAIIRAWIARGAPH